METQELIAEIQRLRLHRDETLVVKVAGLSTNQMTEDIKTKVQHITGHARVLVMPLDAELLIISPESAK